MRDKRFIAQHRGGPLKKQQHYQLMNWACCCAEHVLPLFGEKIDDQLTYALKTAKAWINSDASVGDAMKASLGAHAVARQSLNPTAIAVARSVGQAVAVAHMADHSLGAAWYALKAVKSVGQPVEAEREWQDDQLTKEIKKLVQTARAKRKI